MRRNSHPTLTKMIISHENTMRALKDDPLIMRFWCKIGFHKWTVWYPDSSIKSEKVYSSGDWKIYYTKKCIHCSTPKWKTIRKPNGGGWV